MYERLAVKASFLTLKWGDALGKEYIQGLVCLKWWFRSDYRRKLEFRLQK